MCDNDDKKKPMCDKERNRKVAKIKYNVETISVVALHADVLACTLVTLFYSLIPYQLSK